MLKEEVDEEDIAEVVGEMDQHSGQPLMEGEIQKLIHMEERLHQRVVGQDEAIARCPTPSDAHAPACRIRTAARQLHVTGPTGRRQQAQLARGSRVPFAMERARAHRHVGIPEEKHTVARMIRRAAWICRRRGSGSTRSRAASLLGCALDEVEKSTSEV
jgi:ATP-dependent Clp protease ATP-binding subunit ClpB